MNEQKKYEVIKKLVDTNGNKNRAAVELGCTRRTIDHVSAPQGNCLRAYDHETQIYACRLRMNQKHERRG